MTVEAKRRGRPRNQDRMSPKELKIAEAAVERLLDAWGTMAHLRERNTLGRKNPVLIEAEKVVVEAMSGALAAGMTWRDIGAAVGATHGAAYRWFLRKGGVIEKPEAGPGPAWRPAGQEPDVS